jgi:hypothetical protein
MVLSVLRESISDFRSRASIYIRQNNSYHWSDRATRELIIEGNSILGKLAHIANTVNTFHGLSTSAQIDIRYTFGRLYGEKLRIGINELKELLL